MVDSTILFRKNEALGQCQWFKKQVGAKQSLPFSVPAQPTTSQIIIEASSSVTQPEGNDNSKIFKGCQDFLLMKLWLMTCVFFHVFSILRSY
jgi:hypothetical protein